MSVDLEYYRSLKERCHLKLFSTDRISEGSFCEPYLEALGRLFGSAEAMEIADIGKGTVESRPVGEFAESALVKGFSIGTSAVSGRKNNADWLSKMECNRVGLSGRDEFLNRLGFQQNSVDLMMSSSQVSDDRFMIGLLEYVREIAVLFNCNYMFYHDLKSYDHVFKRKSKLGGGLRDVYWVNVFGGPYIEMIGRDRLLSSPAYKVEEIGESHVLIQVTESSGESITDEGVVLRRKIMYHLGAEYFTKDCFTLAEAEKGESEWIVKAALKSLFSKRDRFSDETMDAEKRPVFDYSNILLED